MGFWNTVGKVADATPLISNVKGVAEGDWNQAAFGFVGKDGLTAIREGATDAKGMVTGSPETASVNQTEQLNRNKAFTDALATTSATNMQAPKQEVGMVTAPTSLGGSASRLAPAGTTIAPARNAGYAQIQAPGAVQANTAQAGTAQAGNTQTAQTADSRGRLTGALGLTQAAAEGAAPSAADRTGAILADKAAARARGLAASLQGRSVGGALTQAQQTGAAAQADIAAQATANRANEQAVARGQLVEGVGALRSGDISQAATDAQLGTTASIANAGNVTNTNVSNARAGENVALTNAGNQLSAATTNANLATSTNVANADRASRQAIAQGQITSTESTAAKELASREAISLANLQQQAAAGNQDAQLRLAALQQAQQTGDRDAYLRALGLETSLVSGIDATNMARSAQNDQFFGGLLSTGGQLYATGGAA